MGFKNKLILCTTGTSIANGCKLLSEVQKQKSSWDDELKEFENEVELKISKIDLNDKQQIRALSAELNTLDRLDVNKNDKIVLLSTDSAGGRVCSGMNEKIIKKLYDCDVEIKRVENLQVYDAKLLRQSGLKNLIRIVLDNYLTNDSIIYSYEIIINPTGGYKGIVPFLTVLGMIYGKYSVYLFEFSQELIKLPPLPLTFNLDLYERVKYALKYIDQEIAITQEEYFSKIIDFDPAEKELFLSFTETYEDNLITLSPLAEVLLNIEHNSKPCKVSPNVLETLQKVNGEKKVILKRLIANASNPLWREQNYHRWKNSEFLIIKQGNTSERLAGFMKDGVFHVALAFANHDEYEKELGKYKIKDFDINSFVEYEEENLKEKNILPYDKLQREYDILKYKYDNFNIEKEQLENEKTELEIKYEEQLEEKNKQYLKMQNQYSLLKDYLNKLSFIKRLKFLFYGQFDNTIMESQSE